MMGQPGYGQPMMGNPMMGMGMGMGTPMMMVSCCDCNDHVFMSSRDRSVHFLF